MSDVEMAAETPTVMTSSTSIEIRYQNRWFGVGLIFCLSVFALLVWLTNDYNSSREVPVDMYDEDIGRIGNDVTNPHNFRNKKDDMKNNPFPMAHSKDYDSSWMYDNLPEDKNLSDALLDLRQKAIWKAWSRAHPNQTLPKSLNWSQWNPLYTNHPPYPVVTHHINPHPHVSSKRTPLSDSPSKTIYHDQDDRAKESYSSFANDSSALTGIQRSEGMCISIHLSN
jgi:hypothetical protein